ncbi:hypothetical protein CBL_20803 [Carabus blaptoides fortunei]
MLGNRNIVWLTIPPMPALSCNKAKHRIKQFNDAVKKLGVQILDLHHLFVSANGSAREEFFQKFYTQPLSRRHLPLKRDGIHFNAKGFHAVERSSSCCSRINTNYKIGPFRGQQMMLYLIHSIVSLIEREQAVLQFLKMLQNVCVRNLLMEPQMLQHQH